MSRSISTTDQQCFERMAELPGTHPEHRRLRNLIVEAHLPMAAHIAQRFRNRGEPIENLVQVASIGLIKSVDSYDINRGLPFASYAIPTIVGELKRHLRDRSWNVRPPRDRQELSLKIQIVTEELGQRLRRSPTVADLATYLRLTERQVLAGLPVVSGRRTAPLDAAARGHDRQMVGNRADSVDGGFGAVDDRQVLRLLLAHLSSRERRLIGLRFQGGLTQAQIAAEVGLSQMHVSRLLRRSLTALHHKFVEDSYLGQRPRSGA